MIPLEFSSSIFWDLDGTLIDMSDEAHEAHRKKDWDRLMAIQVKAPPIEAMVKLARAMSLDHNNILVTARSEKWSYQTKSQLRALSIPYEFLFMRKEGNLDPSPVFKMKVYEQFVMEFDRGRHVSLIIDDRRDVVNAFTARGIPALHYIGA